MSCCPPHGGTWGEIKGRILTYTYFLTLERKVVRLREHMCAAFLRTLVKRGLRLEPGLLCVIDGAKGRVPPFGRCSEPRPWSNAVSGISARTSCVFAERVAGAYRWRLQQAYERATHAEARAALGRLCQELRKINLSAVASLDEALEETLTLHGLGLFPMLGGEPEDHQLCGIPECVARPAHRQGGSLTHVGPKTALSDQCAEPHRAPPAADQMPPPSPAVAGSTAGQDREG